MWRKAPAFRHGDISHTLFSRIGQYRIAFVFVEWYNIFVENERNHEVLRWNTATSFGYTRIKNRKT